MICLFSSFPQYTGSRTMYIRASIRLTQLGLVAETEGWLKIVSYHLAAPVWRPGDSASTSNACKLGHITYVIQTECI